MASQIRCAAMLENVANDNSRMERRVVAETESESVEVTAWGIRNRNLSLFRG